MSLGAGAMIGAGIFILPGVAAANAGPASSLAFAIAGVVALLAAISLSELATGMPVAGGSYHYVNRALGGFLGSIVGWGMWTGLMFASAFYMIGFGQYIVGGIEFLDGRFLVVLFGLIGLTFLVGVNYMGTEESGKFQNWTIGVLTLIILAFLGFGYFYVDLDNLQPFAPMGASGIMATTGIVFVTFLGFEIIATVAEEIKNPGKIIPLTMILSVVLVTILYVMVMIVTTGVVPYANLADSLVPVSDVALISMGTVGVVAIIFAAAVAAISSANSSVLSAARVVFAMGRDKQVNDWMNATHKKFRTPHRAVLATGGITALLVALGLQVEQIVALLAEVASFSFLISYALVHVAVIVIRKAQPEYYKPDFKIPSILFPILPILGVLLSFVVISQMDVAVILIGIGIIFLACAWYFFYSSKHISDDNLVGDAIVRSSIETKPVDEDGEALYRVAVSVANPKTQADLLRLAAASAQYHRGEARPQVLALNIIKVPVQTSLEQNLQFEYEQIEKQRELLEVGREICSELGVDLKTRVIIGRSIFKSVLAYIEQQGADQLVIGWNPQDYHRNYIFGSNLDPIIKLAPCDVTLVNFKREDRGSVLALAGPGPHSPKAIQRAYEFALLDNQKLTLMNVQRPSQQKDGEMTDPEEEGREVIASLAEKAGIPADGYEAKVLVSNNIELAINEAVESFNTVFFGISEQSTFAKILYGSVAARVAKKDNINVVMIRGKQHKHWTLKAALAKRLSE
jgi:basic amino acid/polyamine antiporter, APA family